MAELIHGYQPTDVRCPHCGDSHGARERLEDGTIQYLCWCGARATEHPDG